MIVTFKLFATLAVHLPPEARKLNRAEVEVAEGVTVQGMLDQFRVPKELCTLVLVNGAFVAPDGFAGRVLEAGDVLAIWPPVGGG